jgi:hypothetical protein
MGKERKTAMHSITKLTLAAAAAWRKTIQTNTVISMFTIFSTVLLLAATAAAQYKAVNLVADQPGLAKNQDSNIGDAWDIAELPNGGFAVARFASDHLLVTNVEAGTISVFGDDGTFLGNHQDSSGQDIALLGIWAGVFDNGNGNPKMFYSTGCDFPPDTPSLFGYVTIAAPQDK